MLEVEHFVRLVVVADIGHSAINTFSPDELLILRVPVQPAAELHGDVVDHADATYSP